MSKKKVLHTEKEFNQLGQAALISRDFLLDEQEGQQATYYSYRFKDKSKKSNNLSDIHRLASCIVKGRNVNKFKLEKTKDGHIIKPVDNMSRECLRNLTSDLSAYRSAFPGYDLTPTFKAFETVAMRFQELWRAHEPMPEPFAKVMLRYVTSAVNCLQRRLRTEKNKASNSNFRRNAQKQFHRVLDYINACFQKRANLLSLRLDLSIKIPKSEPHSQQILPKDVTFKLIHKYRAAFTKHVINTFGKGLVGYISKLENAPLKGFHIHFLILLDGSMHQQDLVINKMLKAHWEDKITNGCGFCFDVNRQNQRKYSYPAVGKIHAEHPDVQLGMFFIAAYFTLAEMYVKPNFGEKCKTLTKGVVKPSSIDPRNRNKRYMVDERFTTLKDILNKISWI